MSDFENKYKAYVFIPVFNEEGLIERDIKTFDCIITRQISLG